MQENNYTNDRNYRVGFLTVQYMFEIVVFVAALCFFQLLTKQEIRKDIIVYIVVMTLSLFQISLSTKVKGSILQKIIYILGVGLLAFMYSYRNEIGIDDSAYHRYFDFASVYGYFDYLKWGGIEKGFLTLTYILNKITNGQYFAAQTILSIIPFVFLGIANWKNREHSSLPIAALIIWTHFYPLMMGNGMVRLFISVSIVYYALDLIVRKERLKYCFWIIVAALFHMSALIMLVLLLLTMNGEWLYVHWKLFLVGLIVVIPIGLLFVIKFIVPRMGMRYETYAQIGTLRLSFGLFDVLPVFIIGLLFFRMIDVEKKQKYIVGLILCFLSVLFSVVSTVINMSRLIFYANLGIIIVFSMIEKRHSKTKKYYLFVSAIIVYSLLYMYYTGFWNDRINSILLPYDCYLF